MADSLTSVLKYLFVSIYWGNERLVNVRRQCNDVVSQQNNVIIRINQLTESLGMPSWYSTIIGIKTNLTLPPFFFNEIIEFPGL